MPLAWTMPGGSDTAPVGLLAGAGRFPILFAEKARACGISVVGVGLAGMYEPALVPACDHFVRLRRISFDHTFRALRSAGVERFTMAGKFHKHTLFRPWMWLRLVPDRRALRFWRNRRRTDNKDDSILLQLIAEFRGEGLECVSALDLCPELLVPQGILTRRSPTAAERLDIEFGWRLAKEMGRLDVGQSVMVREQAVLAVEAIEGTDLAIQRAGDLCGRNGFVVVKVAKPAQDMRFDVPTIGTQTIESMKAAGAKVLAVEAGKTILLDEAATIARADRYGMTVVAIDATA